MDVVILVSDKVMLMFPPVGIVPYRRRVLQGIQIFHIITDNVEGVQNKGDRGLEIVFMKDTKFMLK